MFTLLPEEYKRKIVKDYRGRLLQLGLILFIGAVCVGIALLVPSYALVNSKEEELTAEKTMHEVEIAAKNSTNLVEALSSIKTDLAVLQKEDMVPTQIIELILAQKTGGIKIDSLHYILVSDKAGSLNVSGTALLRKELTAFAKALEGVPGIIYVDLPISNLAKDSNLPFSIQISFDLAPHEEK